MTPENDPNQIRFPKFCHRIFWMVFLIETLICFRYPLNLREKNSRFIKISNPLFWWCPPRCSSRFFMITDSNGSRYTKICNNDTLRVFVSTLPFVFSVCVFINIEQYITYKNFKIDCLKIFKTPLHMVVNFKTSLILMSRCAVLYCVFI